MTKTHKYKPQEHAKIRSQVKILEVLTKAKEKVQWSKLLEDTKLSSRTLSDRIKDLQHKGLVKRIVNSNVYPPTVCYEATSHAYLTQLPPTSALDQITLMMKSWRSRQRIIDTRLAEPEKVIEYIIEDYVGDILFTLNYCMEDRERDWPTLLYYHIGAYESRLMEMIRVMHESPELVKAVKETYQKFECERNEQLRQIMERLTTSFKDKELTKALLKQFSVMLAEGYVEKPSEFFEQLLQNKEVREEVEKRFGKSIEDERLKAVMEDPAWKTFMLKRKKLTSLTKP